MAIDDNTSYELTGAQVKDLASRIKGNTKLAKDLTGGESRTSKLIYMAWIDVENALRIADEISKTALAVQNNMVYRFFYAVTGNEIKSPDDLGALIENGYVIEYLNQPDSLDDDNTQETMFVTAVKCIVDDEDEEIYHAELQLKSISQATGNVISKNIVVDHAPSGASYWYKTTTTEGPAGRVACLVQDMSGSGEANGIAAEINASLPEGVDPLSPNLVWSVMDLLFRDPKTGEYCKTISQIKTLLRSRNSYKGQVVYIPHDDNNSAGMVITRYGWTGNATTGHGFVDMLDLNTGKLRTYNVANISQAGFTDNRQYCWYYVYVDSAKMNYSCGFFKDNATVYDVTTDAPSSKFEVAYDANDNLYMAANNSSASDWKQINNNAIVPFTGTDGTAAGTAGLVPAPAVGDTNKYLKSDGTWATVSSGTTWAGEKVFYGTCSTYYYSSAKAVSTSSDFAYEEGVVLFVKFSNYHTNSSFTLNVNSTGAKTVYTNGNSSSNGDYMWKANDIVGFVYDGTYWRMIDSDRASSSYWGKVKLASSYTSSSSDTVPTSSHLYSVYTLTNNKQDRLTAGNNIQINGNTISATGTTYTAGNNIQINGNTISATDTTYTAGTGITIDQNNVISATGGGGGGITGDDAVVIADGAIANAFYAGSFTITDSYGVAIVDVPTQASTNYYVAITPTTLVRLGENRGIYVYAKNTANFGVQAPAGTYDFIVFGQMATPNADLAALSDPDSIDSGDIRGELEKLTTLSN